MCVQGSLSVQTRPGCAWGTERGCPTWGCSPGTSQPPPAPSLPVPSEASEPPWSPPAVGPIAVEAVRLGRAAQPCLHPALGAVLSPPCPRHCSVPSPELSARFCPPFALRWPRRAAPSRKNRSCEHSRGVKRINLSPPGITQ